MKEAVANEVVEGLKDAGDKFASFLPDSWLKPIYFRLTQDPHFMTIPVSNEGVGFHPAGAARRYEGGDVDGEHGVRMACDHGISVGFLLHDIPYRDFRDGQT